MFNILLSLHVCLRNKDYGFNLSHMKQINTYTLFFIYIYIYIYIIKKKLNCRNSFYLPYNNWDNLLII
jgi:hypothetical protein